jgi:hypothetical protein
VSQSQMNPNFSSPSPAQSSGFAVASLVLGIISLFFRIWYIAIPCGILAIIFGVIASNKAKAGLGGGAGMAKAGLIMGVIGLAIDVIIVILIFTVGISFMKNFQKQIQQQQQQQMQQSQPITPAQPGPPTTAAAPDQPTAPASQPQ